MQTISISEHVSRKFAFLKGKRYWMRRLIDNRQIEEIDTYRLSGLRNRVEGKAEE